MKRYLSASLFSLMLLFSASCSDAADEHIASLQLAAPGMHCDGCTAKVEETLAKMDGVDSVYADRDTKNVFVKVDTTLSNKLALEEMIDNMGFATAPMDDE
jgi:Cu2+-exporting ATPase